MKRWDSCGKKVSYFTLILAQQKINEKKRKKEKKKVDIMQYTLTSHTHAHTHTLIAQKRDNQVENP